MKMIQVISVALCFVSGLTAAAPLNQNYVPANAKWICHVDFDAFRTTQFGQLVEQDIRQNWQVKIDAMTQLFGSDMTRDIYSISLFGSKSGEENAVVLVNGKFNQEKLLAMLHLNPSYKQGNYNGIALHYWVDDRDQKNRVGTFARDNLIVISQTESEVTVVLDALSGKKKSLAQEPSELVNLLTEVPENTFMTAAAVELSELTEGDKNAAILQNSTLLALVGSENQGNLTARLRLESESVEAAGQIEAALRGMLAFVTLSQKNNPDLAALAGACNITRNQSVITVQFQYPSQALMDIVKGLARQQSQPQADPNQTVTLTKAK